MSPSRSTPSQQRGPRRPRYWLPRVVALLGLAVATTACDSNSIPRLGMLTPATKQGAVTLGMWQGSWTAALIVGIIVWGGILWAIIFHRKRGDALPRQVRYNLPIEIMYTVLPFIMVGVMFYFTARDENYITKIQPNPNVVVNVTGFQWSWMFQYPQYKINAPNGPNKVVTETGQMWDPNSKVQHLPLLEVPTNEVVKFNLTSVDVIHSFWIVPFEFKRDVIPGYVNHFEVTPIKTGTFIGRCSELCGVYHSRMLFKVKIVTPAQFKKWIQQQQALQSTSGGAS